MGVSIMDVTIVVATFGGREWPVLAMERAIPSAHRQAPTIHAHADTLQNARNKGLAKVETEWVIHLDADDELATGYVDAMSQGTASLRAPAVSYVRDGRAARPRLPAVVGHSHACSADCLAEGNWIVVGACLRTAAVKAVGGWGPEPLWEDWSLFKRMVAMGASVEAIPDAVYRAHVREGSRNNALSRQERIELHRQIAA
jgi:cellulose synthase/poly-beta-1,6-N-acetylglucosamine synthase-like glycosyltransferase